MKRLALLSFLVLFSTNSFAEVCEGLNACTDLYKKLSGDKLELDKNISDEVSVAVPGTDLTPQNYKGEYPLYLSKNTIALVGKKLTNMRKGDFLTAPIYIVSENNMPQMIDKDGLVTLVYHSKNAPSKIVTSKVRNMVTFSTKKPNAHSSILEFPTKVVAVSNTFEYATKIMKEIMKADK